MSLSGGSNWEEYLKEAHRILDNRGGELFVIEGSTRWADNPDNQEPSWSKLTSGLKNAGFQTEKMFFFKCFIEAQSIR
jgi:hypothetical protein